MVSYFAASPLAQLVNRTVSAVNIDRYALRAMQEKSHPIARQC